MPCSPALSVCFVVNTTVGSVSSSELLLECGWKHSCLWDMEKHVGSEEQIASWQSWAATLRSHRLRLAEDEPQVIRSEIFYKGHSQSRMLNSGADALDHCSSAKVLLPSGKHFTRSTDATKQFPSQANSCVAIMTQKRGEGRKKIKASWNWSRDISQKESSLEDIVLKSKNLSFAKIFHISVRESPI